jgi:hypothetical protein
MQPSPSGHTLMSSCLQDHSRGLVQDTNFSYALPLEDTQILDFIRNSKQSGEDNLKQGKWTKRWG